MKLKKSRKRKKVCKIISLNDTATEIKGLKVIYDFLTEWEEADLLSHIDMKPMAVKRGGRSSIKRWGSKKPYNNFVCSDEFPDHLKFLAQRLFDEGYTENLVDSISVNYYDIGDYISPHIDSPESGAVITVLSLMGKADMELTKDDKRLIIPLPQRTLVQLSGELRTDWKHSIPPVTSQRISIVFRDSKNV